MDVGDLLGEGVFDGAVSPGTCSESEPCSEGLGEAASDEAEAEPEPEPDGRGEDRAALPAGALSVPSAEAEKPGMNGTSVSEAVVRLLLRRGVSIAVQYGDGGRGGDENRHREPAGQPQPTGAWQPSLARDLAGHPGQWGLDEGGQFRRVGSALGSGAPGGFLRGGHGLVGPGLGVGVGLRRYFWHARSSSVARGARGFVY